MNIIPDVMFLTDPVRGSGRKSMGYHHPTPFMWKGPPFENCNRNPSASKLPKITSSSPNTSIQSKKKGEERVKIKLPPLKVKKEEVNIWKLLALDYQKEWLEKINKNKMDERRKVKVGLSLRTNFEGF